jgi:hypothetical protein
MTMVKVRTTIEKARVKQKASALKYGRDVDTAAKELLAESEPIEAHLQGEENKVLDEQKRLEAEAEEMEKVKIQGRVDALFAYNVILPYMDVATMSDEEFENLRQKSEEAWSAEKVRLADEEAARIQKDKELADERAELDRRAAQQVKIDKEQANKEKSLRIERDKFDKEKREAQEKKDREAFEKQAAEDAKVQADKDATAKIEREVREAKEKEIAEKAETARQEGLKPDKEKLIAWAESIASHVVPEVHSPEARVIVENAEMALISVSEVITRKAEEM